jgi:hypothetical protein
VPVKKEGKVGKVVRKVQGLSNWARPEKDAGTCCPSCGAGIAPHKPRGMETTTYELDGIF